MLKSFSFGKNQASVLITLLILISLGACYFFIYLPNNEKAVQERRFRCLRKIDINIRTKIDNSKVQIANLLNNYVKNYPTDTIKPNKHDHSKDSIIRKKDSLFRALKTYITEYPNENFNLLLPEQANKYFNDNPNKKTPTYIGEDTSGNKFYIDIGSQFTLLARKVKKNDSLSKNDKQVVSNITNYKTIGIQFEFKQFFKPLLSPDVFDNYIVFVGEQKLYESFPSGLNFNYKDVDSLLNEKRKITSPGVHSLKIGETDYRVFAHPIYTYTDNKWVITGLVSDNNYQKEKNQLPLWALLLLLTAVIAMLVSLPWIKLYHMGSKDRLTINDGIESVLVSMVLMSLLFFVLFKYHFSFKEERLPYQEKKTKSHVSYPQGAYSRNILATKVTNAFEGEIDIAYNLLNSFDAIHKKTDKDVYLLGKGKEKLELLYDSLFAKNGKFKLVAAIKHDTLFAIKDGKPVPIIGKVSKGKKIIAKKIHRIPDVLFTKYDTLFQKTSHNIDVSQIFWIDGAGNGGTNLSVASNIAPPGNYNSRNYFKKAILKKYNKTGNHKFYVDQIISRTEGIFRTVIAKKKSTDSVIAMTFTMNSLDSVIMPDGYQFAIINNNGRVLYHSRPNRNLNENLKDELVDSSELVSCIAAQSDTSFRAEYYGRQYNVKIKPLPNLSYFTIIFEDLEYNDMRDTEAYAFTLSMLICLLIFLIIKYSVVFFVSSRHSYFKRQHFDTSWIGPHVRSHHQYNLAIIANIFMILILVIFFNFSSFLEYLYILLDSVVFTSLFLNLIFAGKYKNTDPYKYNFKKTAIIWLSLFILVIDIVAWFNLRGHVIYIFLYQLILIGVYPIIFIWGQFLLAKAREYKIEFNFSWTFTHSYALMVVTRLIISSGIPVAFFFIFSYNYEQNLDTRYRQLDFAKALSQKGYFTGQDTTINNRLDRLKNNQIVTAGVYFDELLIDSIKVEPRYQYQPIDKLKSSSSNSTASGKIDTIDKFKPISAYNHEDFLTAEILNTFRLQVNSAEIKNSNLNLPSIDSTVYFSKLNKHCGDASPTQTFYKIGSNKYVTISSLSSTSYGSPHLLFWFLLIGMLFMFYYIIHQVIRKLFALNLHPTEGWGQMDSKLLRNNKFNKLVLIVGSPGSNTLSKLKYKITKKKIKSNNDMPLVLEDADPSKVNVFIADMMKISVENGESDISWVRHKKEILSGHSLTIINHFEYNIKDPSANKIKLDLLEELLMQRKNNKVIIISTMHPLTFLDSFSQQQNNPIPESELGRWHALLGNFRVVIDPLISSEIPEGTQMPDRAIMEETKYSRFLHRMQKISLKYMDKGISSILPEEEIKAQITDSMIFKLQLTSQYFYTDIWQSLTREEKFILSDLAEDGLVNSSDSFNMSMLMCKGLIIKHDGVLTLFNKSFRNFILTAIGESEIKRIKDQVKDNGKWGNLKAPMGLIILAILAFLFASQQEAYSHVITYITALGAGIPAILKIFSMFGGSSSTDTKKTE